MINILFNLHKDNFQLYLGDQRETNVFENFIYKKVFASIIYFLHKRIFLYSVCPFFLLIDSLLYKTRWQTVKQSVF